MDRFSVSLETELLAAFDAYLAAKGYNNRSEAIRDIIRDQLVSERLQGGTEPVVAWATLVCDHRVGDAARRIRAVLSSQAEFVLGTLAVRVDNHREALAVALRGATAHVRLAADQLHALRGVTHGRLSAVPTVQLRQADGV